MKLEAVNGHFGFRVWDCRAMRYISRPVAWVDDETAQYATTSDGAQIEVQHQAERIVVVVAKSLVLIDPQLDIDSEAFNEFVSTLQ